MIAFENPVALIARAASGDSGPLTTNGVVTWVRAQLKVTAASGTTPTLDVVIEDTLDGGVTWHTVGAFAQKVAPGGEAVDVINKLMRQLRVRWTIGGTAGPSFTFAVDWNIQYG